MKIAKFALCFSIGFASIGGSTAETLRVVVSDIQPCVRITENSIGGFSVDLWRAIAERLALSYDLVPMRFGEKMDAIRTNAADVALGCVSITSAREKQMDFTLPVADGGFRAMSLVGSNWLPRFSDQSRKMILILFAFVVFFAHLMWWSEQGKALSKKYVPGIFEAIWFSVVTMSTVGYGDIAPRRWLGKISAILLILSGVTAFGVIFGQFAADAIEEQAENSVTTLSNLRQYEIGTKKGTAADEFLHKQGVEPQTYETIESAFDALLNRDIDLIFYDAVTLIDLSQGDDRLVLTGPVFDPHHFGIALQKDSKLREPINVALLELRESGLYATIHERWF